MNYILLHLELSQSWLLKVAEEPENGGYREELLEEDTGAANVLHFRNRRGQDVLVAANREIDEVAMFLFEP